METLENLTTLDRISDILDQTHYNTFLHNDIGIQYENRNTWHFGGILATLVPEPGTTMTGLTIDGFQRILKEKNIKHVCEIGPGTTSSSIVGPIAEILIDAGCKISVVSPDPLSADLFRRRGISVIEKMAGELNDPTMAVDITIARDVFSFGGQLTAGISIDNPANIINGIEKSVLDLINSMNKNNPFASIILSEFHDILPLRKTVMEKHAKVSVWHELSTDNGWLYRNQPDNYPKYMNKIFQQSPNFVVLQNKAA